MGRYLKISGGCTAVGMGTVWLLCGIYADLVRDGYGGVLLSVGFYYLWIWLGGYCFSSAGVSRERIRKWVAGLWFLGYLYLLMRFTLFEPAYNREIHLLWKVSKAERIRYLQENVNPIPLGSLMLFWRAMRYGYLPWSVCLVNILGNLAVFAPMPCFLAGFLRRKRIWIALLLTGVTVILVETLQIVTMCGSADVDDFLLNMLGAVISSCFVKGLRRKSRGK
ncbi:MAG: VanZ family protein [Clostridia bacterium]|nr:VanZ family protein [Clostridia bacterium]